MRATFSKNSGNKTHLGLKGGGRVWQFFLYNIRGEPFIDWLETEDNHMYMLRRSIRHYACPTFDNGQVGRIDAKLRAASVGCHLVTSVEE